MAATAQGVVGKNNNLPWNFPGDLDFLRNMTKGHVVIMGRKTFETIPTKFLSERIPIIFSRNNDLKIEQGHVVRSLEECFYLIKNSYNEAQIFMIGGAKIASLFFEKNLLSSFFLTKIHYPYPGDTYIDMGNFKTWTEKVIIATPDYTIVQLKNPKVPCGCLLE